ncbi:hypothetical protein, partial [Streptomyces sp. SA15]|uniref:hypothetical protein n=1 Tax=Streptomyces sp. SA15 TaxID=934019 RepID=UPI00117DC349
MNGNDGRPSDRDGCGNGMNADMGEPHNDGRAPGRRRVHPGDAVTGPEGAALEALLSALPQPGADTGGEQR